MSQPIKRWKFALTRCDCVKCKTALTIEQTEEDCGWVRWFDVAALAAENERLREAWIDKKMEQDRDALLAENERLRKAGDDLERDLFLRMNLNAPLPSSIAEWNAAKEGRDAK